MKKSFVLIVIFTVIHCSPGMASAPGPFSGADSKAMYVNHFIKFVKWPNYAFKHPESPLVIGVLGISALESS